MCICGNFRKKRNAGDKLGLGIGVWSGASLVELSPCFYGICTNLGRSVPELSEIVKHPSACPSGTGELLGVENPAHLVSEGLWIKEKALPFISHLSFKVVSNRLSHNFLFRSKDLMNTVCWAQTAWWGCSHDLDRAPVFNDNWYHNLTWGDRQKPLIKRRVVWRGY